MVRDTAEPPTEPPKQRVPFASLSVDDLRARARATGPGDWGAYDRAMLEAFFSNRLRRDYFWDTDDGTPEEVPLGVA